MQTVSTATDNAVGELIMRINYVTFEAMCEATEIGDFVRATRLWNIVDSMEPPPPGQYGTCEELWEILMMHCAWAFLDLDSANSICIVNKGDTFNREELLHACTAARVAAHEARIGARHHFAFLACLAGLLSQDDAQGN